MLENITPIKTFLGKYYSELLYSATQDKYRDSGLDNFFEQRFFIQNNKVQMIIDPALPGLAVIITGNEIHISKEFYDHPNVVVSNSLEHANTQAGNPKSLYNPETFSTVAYLICQNHTMFQIVGEIDEPIYITYKTDFETFLSSVVVFEVSNNIEVEIIEEIESFSALNAVTNYILHPESTINLRTIYKNNISAASFVYRNIICQEKSNFSHVLLGQGSASIIDENKISCHLDSTSEFLGIVNSNGKHFHSILFVHPLAETYRVSVDYRDILAGKSKVTFFPVILGQVNSQNASISVSNITISDIPAGNINIEVINYIKDIIDRATLNRMIGVKRFYDNKARFLNFP